MILSLIINPGLKNKRKPIKTNLKGPIRVCVPKREITFDAYMLKGKNKATTSVLGQWFPNSEGGRKCGIWKGPGRREHWYWEG